MLAKTVGLLLLEDIPTMADMTLSMGISSKRRYFHRSHPFRRESINYKCMDFVNAFLTEGSFVLNLQAISVTQKLAARFSLPRAGRGRISLKPLTTAGVFFGSGNSNLPENHDFIL